MAGAQFPVWGERPRVKQADTYGVCAPVPPMPAHSRLTCLSLLRPGRGRHPRGADQGGFRAGGRRAAAVLRGAGEDGSECEALHGDPAMQPDVRGAVAAAREAGGPGWRGGPCAAGAALSGVRRRPAGGLCPPGRRVALTPGRWSVPPAAEWHSRPADGLCPLATEWHSRPAGGLCLLAAEGHCYGVLVRSRA